MQPLLSKRIRHFQWLHQLFLVIVQKGFLAVFDIYTHLRLAVAGHSKYQQQRQRLFIMMNER